MNYQERLLKSIPGGAHTYSRGYDQFPSNTPEILERGEGVYVFDTLGTRFLDYGMAVRAVNIGYAEPQIDEAAIKQIRNGTNLTRPSIIELEAAELLIDLIDSVEMVKFTKNGSTAVTAAVKLARAYTGRDLVARCAEQPFFSYDDWFIGSTPIVRGIPKETISKTKTFSYNDIFSLESLIEQYPGEIACVILEPAATECPSIDKNDLGCCGLQKCSRDYSTNQRNYLQQVHALCKKHGIVFVLDEMITGFRWDVCGAQRMYGIKPDLSTFGKAMANGYALACVAGRREIMELGSIEFEGQERVFLLSSTHGAEMGSLGAFRATVEFIHENNVINHIWKYGSDLINLMNRKANEHNVASSFKVGGVACSPYFTTLDSAGVNSLELRTLFVQEMIKSGVIMPWISISFRHGLKELELTEIALDRALRIYARALNEGVEKYLVGPSIRPVFRKYN
jgi:glutamate-1-semialdehyde 2,1-aminomutase